ncbi:MAG TPA: hypothetical protein VGN78_10190 [Solirubrobacteraceae bacterium]|nr:hypothetical protein [Solirubrobacteraceae bacterium]
MPALADGAVAPADAKGLAEPPDPGAPGAPVPRVPAPRFGPATGPPPVERRCTAPSPEELVVGAVEPVPGRAAWEPEPVEPLAPAVDELPDPEPPPRGALSDAPPPEPLPDPPPAEPPPSPDPPVEGTGTEGTLTGGVDTGPTLTAGTFTGGVDDGVGTLGPTGRSTFAGMAVSVGTAASAHTSPTSAKTVASAALRKTPAVVIPEYPQCEL